jgi:hypothetical protein
MPTPGPRPNYFWIIDANHNVRCVDTMEEWTEYFESGTRIIARTGDDHIRVSTVFLGLNHNWKGHGPPILFETMIFGGEHDDYQVRYATYDEAIAGHQAAVALAFKYIKAGG